MARARYLVREGRVADAEKAYRDLLAEHPDLKPGGRSARAAAPSGRAEDALRARRGRTRPVGDAAFSLALKGAALIELTRYRKPSPRWSRRSSSIRISRSCGTSGYARFRAGDRNRACSRSTGRCLEPHTETLRGTRTDSARRRALPGGGSRVRGGRRRPSTRSNARGGAERSRQRGASFLRPAPAGRTDPASAGSSPRCHLRRRHSPLDDASLAAASVDLARDSGWRFGQIVALNRLGAWRTHGGRAGAPSSCAPVHPAACPWSWPSAPSPRQWMSTLTAAVAEHATGSGVVLGNLPSRPPRDADVIGVLADAADGGHGRRTSPPAVRSAASAGPPGNRPSCASRGAACCTPTPSEVVDRPPPPATSRAMSGKSIVDSQFERRRQPDNLDDYMRRILMRRSRGPGGSPVRRDDGGSRCSRYRSSTTAREAPARAGIPSPHGAGPRDHHDWKTPLWISRSGGARAASRWIQAPLKLELERLTRPLHTAHFHRARPYRDVPAPTSPPTRRHGLDPRRVLEPARLHAAAVTGKPVSLAVAPRAREATGRGVMYLMMEYSPTSVSR